MKLLKLIKNIETEKLINYKNVNIKSLSMDSRAVEKGGLFFAISGNNFNGEMFGMEAEHKGAVAIVSSKQLDVSIPQIIVKDVRKAMALVSKQFFNNSCEKLKIIQVIGTNGKTTTSTIIYHMLRFSGKKVGLIGTNGVYIDNLTLPSFLTTPDPIELHYMFEQMVLMGVEYCVMEVSAQAIYYNKLEGVNPEIIVYTNITPEHLDFFGDMNTYVSTKLNYIKGHQNAKIVANSDDEYAKTLLDMGHVTSYGLFNPADIFAINIKMNLKSSSFLCNANDDILKIESRLVGEYNVYNLLASIAVGKICGMSGDEIKAGIRSFKGVDGRWEVFDFKNNNKVIVDYAHTPDGIEKVLSLVKNLRHGRIITLFGCVGYSTREKRKQMGDIVKKYSDFAIITSDNYSDEDFDKIFDDIGINKYYAKIENRAKAVGFAMNMLDKNDTLLLLGKGAETVQKTKDGNVEYSELKIVKEYQKKDNVG